MRHSKVVIDCKVIIDCTIRFNVDYSVKDWKTFFKCIQIITKELRK